MDSTPSGSGPRGEDWLRNGGSRSSVAGSHAFTSGSGPAWLTRNQGDHIETISEDATCAQVDPLRLCQFLLSQCQARGVQLHQPASAVSSTTSKGKLVSVTLSTGTEIPCTTLLVSAGAWTPRVFGDLFLRSGVRVPISSLAGHSLVLRSPRWAVADEGDCHAVFSTLESGLSPEIFSRVGGEIYVAGLNSSSIKLPERATDAVVEKEAIDTLKGVGEKMLGLGGDGKSDLEVLREGLCFRPVTPRGTPILSRVEDKDLGLQQGAAGEGGVFVAAGHGPWGISLSLGTGLVMAEMMTGRKTSARVKGLGL